MGFIFTFILTIIHSIWQSCLLLCIYAGITAVLPNIHPLAKRNFLYSLIFTQFLLSLISFGLLYGNDSIQVLNNYLTVSLRDNAFFKFIAQNEFAIFFTYILIVVLKFSSLFFQWQKFCNSYKKNIVKPAVELKVFTELHAYHLGIKKKIKIWYSHSISTPVTFGFFKPVILLPFSIVSNLSSKEIETVILHELSHIKNKDYLLNWVMLVMDTLYFFNPFLKIIIEKIKTEREKNCDVQVMNFNYNALFYAEVLLKIAKNASSVKSFQLAAVKRHNTLLQRIHFFSDSRKMSFTRTPNYVFSGLFLMFTAATILLIVPSVNDKNAPDIISQPYIVNTSEKAGSFAVADVKPTIAVTSPKTIVAKKRNNSLQKITEAQLSSETINESEYNDINYQQVSYSEPIDSVKEIIYNTESKFGTITQSYKLIFKNGDWVLQPQWMIVEKNADSQYLQRKDSTLPLKVMSIQ